jgi:hypothetical protein
MIEGYENCAREFNILIESMKQYGFCRNCYVRVFRIGEKILPPQPLIYPISLLFPIIAPELHILITRSYIAPILLPCVNHTRF